MLGWLRARGIYTGPRLEMDSLRIVQESMERLQPRGHGPDPLAEAFPVGRDVVSPLQVTGLPTPTDLLAKLRRQMEKEHP